MFALPFLAFAGLFWLEWRRTDDRPRQPLPLPVVVMAASSLAAAAVHGAVIGEHVNAAGLLGVFFLALTVAQIAYAGLLLAVPTLWVVRLGVATNLGVVCLWAWTRTIGIPFGIAGGAREPAGVADLMATGFEVTCVLAGVVLVYRATGGWPSPEEVPASKWDTSTVRNSPPPRKVSTPSGLRPSHETNSLRPSKLSTFATRS